MTEHAYALNAPKTRRVAEPPIPDGGDPDSFVWVTRGLRVRPIPHFGKVDSGSHKPGDGYATHEAGLLDTVRLVAVTTFVPFGGISSGKATPPPTMLSFLS